jgi:hypothetical protein
MTKETTFRIHLPTLFAKVNQRRREEGLPAVEPAVMAVRASIKFAIRRQKYVNLKGSEVDVAETDAQHLCEALGELFNVKLKIVPVHGGMVDLVQVPAADDAGDIALAPVTPKGDAFRETTPTYVLPLVQFYAAINKARRAKGLVPVEPAVISVRTGVKFSIMRRRPINFQATRLTLDEDDLKALENILAQQFDVSIAGGLASLCERPASGAGAAIGDEKRPPDHGILSRLLGRIAGDNKRARHYSMDTNSLLLAILKRRAYMGHKPIPPETVRQKCAQALRVELELETDMRNPELALSAEQLDAFADIIRREFQIMFDHLDDLMQEPAKPKTTRATKTQKRKS